MILFKFLFCLLPASIVIAADSIDPSGCVKICFEDYRKCVVSSECKGIRPGPCGCFLNNCLIVCGNLVEDKKNAFRKFLNRISSVGIGGTASFGFSLLPDPDKSCETTKDSRYYHIDLSCNKLKAALDEGMERTTDHLLGSFYEADAKLKNKYPDKQKYLDKTKYEMVKGKCTRDCYVDYQMCVINAKKQGLLTFPCSCFVTNCLVLCKNRNPFKDQTIGNFLKERFESVNIGADTPFGSLGLSFSVLPEKNMKCAESEYEKYNNYKVEEKMPNFRTLASQFENKYAKFIADSEH